MTKDEKIKEVMAMVEKVVQESFFNGQWSILSFEKDESISEIEAKLRQLIQ